MMTKNRINLSIYSLTGIFPYSISGPSINLDILIKKMYKYFKISGYVWNNKITLKEITIEGKQYQSNFFNFFKFIKSTIEADIILFNSPPIFLLLIPFIIGKILNKPMIYYFRGGLLLENKSLLIKIIFEKIRKHLFIITTSNSFKKKILEKFPNSKIYVIYNPIPLNLKSKEISKPLSKRNEQIVYIGRLNRVKGVHILIKAYYKLKTKIPLMIIGKGPQENSLKKLVKDLNLDKEVHFLDFISDQKKKYEIISSSLIQIIPSIYQEPFGLVALEGMICGTPIIAAKSGGLKEIIEDNFTGLLYDPLNIDQLCKKMLKLINNKSIWTKIHQNQLNVVFKRFSQKRYTRDVLDTLKKILEKHNDKKIIDL